MQNAGGVDDLRAALAAVDRGNHDEAIRLFTSAIESGDLSVKDQGIVFYNRGNVWRNKKDYDRAIADYTEAIRLIPQNADAFNNRGLAWGSKKDYDRAAADFSEAIRLNRQDANPFYNRGKVWYNKKDYDRAIADFTQAKSNCPVTFVEYDGAVAELERLK